MMVSSVVSLAALATSMGIAVHAAGANSEPNPIYPFAKFRKRLREVPNGVLYRMSAPDNASLLVMHLYGGAEERGVAHGMLLHDELVGFFSELDGFYKNEVDQIPWDKLPAWLGKLAHPMLKSAAPEVFHLAFRWLYAQQKDRIPFRYWQEARGIAHGVCAVDNSSTCDENKWFNTIAQLQMLPELIRMQCSMMGAWGPSTANHKLVQLRTLDFGGGPFPNRNVLVVHHPTDSPTAFASLSFPGFIGMVTGFSETIAQSEKVDDVTGASRPAGTYKGEAVAMVIRDIVQFAQTKEQAVEIAQNASRTWSVWLGVGDYASQSFVAMNYQMKSAKPYDDKTLPSLTNQTAFPGVAYIDKHPQPSTHPDMPQLVKQFYGNMTAENVAQNFPRLMHSGDVHTAVFDFGRKQTLIQVGTTDESGAFTRFACDAPVLAFDMEDLWNEPKPSDSARLMV
jgi:hypothetical protein